jgi:ABC-type multidrug transport system fused ATPase/permease subunit
MDSSFYWTAVFWLRVRFDLYGAASIAILTAICVWRRLDVGWTAFAIVSAQTFVGAVHSLIWTSARLELDLSSVERIDDLLRITQETTKQPLPSIPAYWPSSEGGISVENLTFKYDESLPPVIENLSLHIPPRTKLAIVGRSGSAKSTLSLALVRVAEYQGTITMDGLDIARVPLHELRQRISYCPQEPLLFAGTLRDNLTPDKTHSDDECKRVLREVGLETLDLDQEIGSVSLSAGQRNLVSLARCLIRNSTVFILDESTAALDPEADARIQQIVRGLSNAIVISIAHRLSTIIEFDQVVVMDQGLLS